MIQVTDVTKKFGNTVAVDHVSFTVHAGEIFGLVGPDGAGKTTVIRMITGIMELTDGTIEMMGSTASEAIKSQIGYVPQKFSLYRDLTVLENIELIGSLYGAKRQVIQQLAEEILTFTGLWEFRDRLSENLSGGMKQKLALAAGLMHKPKLFFLDEPTTGVDPVSRREFWQMLYRLNKEGMTVIAATPYMDEAELCTRIAFMDQGKIVACASPQELRAQYEHHILELQVDSKNVKPLLQHCQIIDINSFGDKYHLVVNDVDQAIVQVQATLSSAGRQVLSLKEIAPTLEDIFVSLAGGGTKYD
ncbi:multidrug ABC transporter ATP-binding protein [Sporomusaceae bacterium FL31]|nr:multidrug ABC transporter ATP-binding protein [Sporomusaceae bacterium FL31]GCE34729.1 multidrug ABC transporter ATP-binding protein [Sporomusaceae bacterium]